MSDPARQSANHRFPKSSRLLRHADFERVYKQGRRHFGSHMTVFYLLRENESGPSGLRIGFTVSKALGGAVQRNRMKRRLREAVRLKTSPVRLAADVVINPKRSLLAASFGDLENDIAEAFYAIARSMRKEKGKQQG